MIFASMIEKVIAVRFGTAARISVLIASPATS
jgi:hypothetical protein